MEELAVVSPPPPQRPRWARADGGSIFIGVLGLVLGWVLLFFWPATILGDIWLLSYLNRQRQLMARVYLFLNPTVVLFSLSLLAPLVLYWTGDAAFWGAGIGVPQADFGDFDRETRTDVTGYGGDLFLPVELLISIPANSILALMCAVIGPVPGTYHGPLPTRQEALRALEAEALETPLGEFKSGSFQFGPRRVWLDKEAVSRSLEYTVLRAPGPPEYFVTDGSAPRVALFQSECLIIRTQLRERERGSGAVLVSLVDLGRGEVFAQELNNGSD